VAHLAAWRTPRAAIPATFAFIQPRARHWSVPLPTDGNVHGWAWFYFVNEQVLRYLNLRVPRDYDTVPLWLFWGLCLIWLMPWSAFVFNAIATAVPLRIPRLARTFRARTLMRERTLLLLLALWAAFRCCSFPCPHGRSTTSFPRCPR
jgi:hypothetical protein